MRLHKNLFTHQFGSQKPIWQVCQIIFRVQIRAFGQACGQLVQQVFHTIAGACAYHEHMLNGQLFRNGSRKRQQGCGGHKICLVQHQPDLALGFCQTLDNGLHCFCQPAAGIYQQQRDVCIFGTRPGSSHHGAVQLAAGAENSRRVHQQNLAMPAHKNAQNPKARGLRLGRNDGQLGTSHAVKKC